MELGLPAEDFFYPGEIKNHVELVAQRGSELRKNWDIGFSNWSKANSSKVELLERLVKRALPEGWNADLPIYGSDKEVSTRKASGDAINALAKKLPELFGGSSDLADSNNTTIEDGGSFLPASSLMKGANPYGRIVHFGIREHAMGAILNGMALHGLVRPFGGTFLVFSDYMRGAVRLSALMDLPVTYVWSHDSIGLGEDGPTHQPVEHIAALRAIPNLEVIRPADANEVVHCWQEILQRNKPAGILLSRQNLPVIERENHAAASEASRGAYALNQVANPDVILIATGSEVYLALKAAELLSAEGISARVVSAPCLEWFNQQDSAYKEKVLPKQVKARVSVEAGIAQGWREYIGDFGVSVSLEHFGASASAGVLFKEFGFTPEKIAAAAKQSIANTKS